MKKKSYAARLGALAVALTMMTASLMGGTLAKYTSEETGTGTAVVAKWNFNGKINGNDPSVTKEFTIADTAKTGFEEGTIAPGTNGTIPFYVDLSGTQVNTKITVEIKVEDVTTLPKNFKITGPTGDAITLDNKGAYVTAYTVDKTTTEINTNAIVEGDINWNWLYETKVNNSSVAGDKDDTSAGEAFATSKFTVRVTATQIVPEAKPVS